MKEVTIISGKGGTGKTSLLAAFAALSDRPVIADCDVDASNMHLILSPKKSSEFPIIGSQKAYIDPLRCTRCMKCQASCRFCAIDEELVVRNELCEGCAVCNYVCPEDAIDMLDFEAGSIVLANTRFGRFSYSKMKSGEEGSGKLVTAVRKQAREVAEKYGSNIILIDGPPGIGCPVIASIIGTNLALIVCEPTLSGLHDLKRVAALAMQMNVPVAVCVNKYDINESISCAIEDYCDMSSIPVLGKVPYDLEFVNAMVRGKCIMETRNDIKGIVAAIWDRAMAILF
ncbi:MAG: ATP-binding protein [Candidatus Methanofastidiosa archaeon]|nr:ATP-binding protein [Candidatus Methanofastidiosa archaeon]